MTAPLQALLALQEIDTAIDQVRHRRAHLPSKAAVKAIASERQQLGVRRATAAQARDAAAGRQEALEAELAATEQRRTAVSKRMYSGEVSASRELSAMAADVESLAARSAVLEDDAFAVLEEREPLDAVVDAIDAQDADLAARQVEAEGHLAAEDGELAAQEDDLVARRTGAAVDVPADLTATYERIRARMGGVGVARVVGNLCGGCHLAIPATELDRLRHQPEGMVVTCEQCGRILVP